MKKRAFGQKLFQWYQLHQRDLPWRKTHDPYHIWISEIILQQTQVVQGLDYYLRFIAQFPTLADLAAASEEQVLKLWQGLGYYSRARNLHTAAKQVMTEFNGVFPKTHGQILSLKGIGDYTAAAVSSFAYNLPYAVLDGNVYRLLSRLFGIETPIDTPAAKKEFYSLVQSLLVKKDPAQFNNAIMEFGAIQCTPKTPNCTACIFKDKCVAFKTQQVHFLPTKKRKLKQRNRFFNYLLILDDEDNFYIEKREKGIWKNLYQLPLIETAEAIGAIKVIKTDAFAALFSNTKFEILNTTELPVHLLSHQRIYSNFITIKVESHDFSPLWKKVDHESVHGYPLPKLIESFLNTHLS